MADYPIILNLEGRLCVVVGAGAVGMRKVRGLLAAGARVRLVDPLLAGQPTDLPGVVEVTRPFRPEDLTGAALAFAAAGSREVNAVVARESRQRGIPVNVGDLPGEGDFALPALLRRGALMVAVATGGESPALAALVRDRLTEELGPEWETVVTVVAALRRKRLTLQEKGEYNQAILRRLLDGGLPALVADRNRAGVDRLLEDLFGEGVTLAALDVRMPTGKP